MTTGKVNSHGIPLNKRTGPGTSYPAVGAVPDGSTVTIVCQTSGTTVTGNYGPTSLWDRLEDNTYVSDAWIFTGTNNMVAPPCNLTPLPPGGTVQAAIQQRLDRFVSDWAGKYLNYGDTVPDQCFSVAQAWSNKYLGLPEFTCEYAGEIIGQGGTDFARADYAPGKFPPPGAIVVFHQCPAQGIGEAGHVDVCISANASSFVGFDQNWPPGSPCHQLTHLYQGVTGWLTANRLGLTSADPSRAARQHDRLTAMAGQAFGSGPGS